MATLDGVSSFTSFWMICLRQIKDKPTIFNLPTALFLNLQMVNTIFFYIISIYLAHSTSHFKKAINRGRKILIPFQQIASTFEARKESIKACAVIILVVQAVNDM